MKFKDSPWISAITVPIRIVLLMWAVFFFEITYHIDLGFLGVLPRTFKGLIGIITAPFIHGSFIHLISNTFPLLFLGGLLYFFYDRIAGRVFQNCFIGTNILVWIFARPFYHIGASGLIYGIASFLIFFGIFRKNLRALIISVLVVVLYGSLAYGMFPTHPWVSWESHLSGAIVGMLSALRYSRVKRFFTE